MKTITFNSCTLITLASLYLSCHASASLFEDDFNSYNDGNLAGQGGWTSFSGQVQVLNGPVGSINTSKVLGKSTLTNSTQAQHAVDYDFGSNPQGSLSFDFYRNAGSGHYAGIAAVDTVVNQGMGFIVTGNPLVFRPGLTSGTQINLTDVAGTQIAITSEKWYRVEMLFSVDDSRIDEIWLQNLSDSGSPVQLYFGASIATFDMGTAVSSWDALRVRVAESTSQEVFFDNVVVTAIPEPTTFGMLALVLGAALFIRRKRLP